MIYIVICPTCGRLPKVDVTVRFQALLRIGVLFLRAHTVNSSTGRSFPWDRTYRRIIRQITHSLGRICNYLWLIFSVARRESVNKRRGMRLWRDLEKILPKPPLSYYCVPRLIGFEIISYHSHSIGNLLILGV